ncbi:MAG: hypothetical protein SVN78_01340 [Deferribacterota bacterium]|nr:hypothetical protein [Deferribacterota bacterium]
MKKIISKKILGNFNVGKKETLALFSTIIFAFSSAYVLTMFIYKKHDEFIIKLPDNFGEVDQKKNEIDTELILEKNPLKIDVYNEARMQALEEKASIGSIEKNENAAKNSEFEGDLVGILKGKIKSYALIRTKDNFYVLSVGDVADGISVESINLKDVVILYGGKKYRLFLEEDGEENIGEISEEDNSEGGTIKRTVSRKDVKENLSDINSLISTMYISPYYLDGKFVGYRIGRMRMDAFLRKAGLENGDVLVRMNGEEINTPEKMFELFTNWQNESAVTIDILRRNERRTILVEIK